MARIGTSAATVLRRAVIDGASPAEAQILADAIADLRAQYAMPATNPQTFRPFQPGGAVLPGDTPQARDAAFGRQLQQLLPTLMGSRIGTLAQAQKARDELIDLARGSNAAGANGARFNMRSLPTGIPFPQWSADAFNATGTDLSQTSLNDWISDLAMEPTDADRPQWLALQHAYLANPSNANFWRLFAFVDKLVVQPAGYIATLTQEQRGLLQNHAGTKYRSTLIGQQLLRTTLAGTTAEFLGEGAVAFNYLLADTYGVFLPNYSIMPHQYLWNVADVIGRGELQGPFGATSYYGPLTDTLAELGFPKFVEDSTRSPAGRSMTRGDAGQEIRLSWFWLGFTFDPSLFRTGVGSTQSGEYFHGTLQSEDYKMWIHDAFVVAISSIACTLPETGCGQYDAFMPGYTPKASEFRLQGGYASVVRPDWVTPDQKPLYATLLTNVRRMSLLLYADVLGRSRANKISQGGFDEAATRSREIFNAYDPQNQAADEALIQQVKTLGVVLADAVAGRGEQPDLAAPLVEGAQGIGGR